MGKMVVVWFALSNPTQSPPRLPDTNVRALPPHSINQDHEHGCTVISMNNPKRSQVKYLCRQRRIR